jgi:predicted O-methyltransferase YrrM
MNAVQLARHAVSKAVNAAATEGMRAVALDRVTRNTEGFEEAWKQANGIPGWFTQVNASAFWTVIQETQPKTVVEIGSYLGRSTALIGLGLKRFSPDARFVAIDPHTGDRQHLDRIKVDVLPTEGLFRQHMRGAGLLEMLDIRVAMSEEVAAEWSGPVDLLYIDGWHSYDAVKGDAQGWLPHLTDDGLVCFDDVGTYPEVRQATMEVCQEFGLTVYGPVMAQMWAGRRAVAPEGLQAAIKWTKPSRGARRAKF